MEPEAPDAPEDALSAYVRDYIQLNPDARAAFSEDDAEALREASTFARWIDRAYRPQLQAMSIQRATPNLDELKRVANIDDATVQSVHQCMLESEAARHLGEELRELGDLGVRRIRECVDDQEEHEEAQALPPLRGCEASTRLLQREAELCQQVMQFLTLTLTRP